jgi:catechol 2,3-dioxygenase-like lactoylglutathione lyase family enzyme
MTHFVAALDHVQLAIPEGGEPLARTFFVEVLGFVEVEKPPALAVRGGCWFRSGAAVVHVGIDPHFVPATKAHPAFVVERFDDLEVTLRAAGAPFVHSDEIEGTRRAFTTDPFGNRIEVIAA